MTENEAANRGRIEERIAEWRRGAGGEAEREGELRERARALVEAGLTPDEAFLIAVGRMGGMDEKSRGFARRLAERLWPDRARAASGDAAPERRREFGAAFLLAVAAAAGVAVVNLIVRQLDLGDDDAAYYRTAVVFVLFLFSGFFAWKRRLSGKGWLLLAAPFLVVGFFAHLYPFAPNGASGDLATVHLPIVLWLAVGVAYAGSRWKEVEQRLAFVRFSGGWFITFVLVAAGGGLLVALSQAMFAVIEIPVEDAVLSWVIPSAAAGAVVICAWLAETWGKTTQQIAPMLARVFTPLVAAVLLVFLGAMAWTGRGLGADREVLIAFDLLLALVLGLLIYVVASRDPDAPPGLFDWLTGALVAVALLVDVAALAGIVSRISDFGFSPNKTAALGENLVILANLGWSAWLYGRFLFGRGSFRALERWQTAYLPVYSAWAALVVIAFPPLFRYA